jgi:Methyltransferase domain
MSVTVLGWLPSHVEAEMRRIMIAEKPHLTVEIGVFGGQSLLALAESAREVGHGVVYGIDPWSIYATERGFPAGSIMIGWAQREGLETRRVECHQAIGERELWPWVKILTARSQDVFHLFDDGSIDMLHIDGNHADPEVLLDVQTYVQCLCRPGAYVWVDDIGHDETFRAVHLLRETCNLAADFGRYLLMRRK